MWPYQVAKNSYSLLAPVTAPKEDSFGKFEGIINGSSQEGTQQANLPRRGH